ncbi:MAG: MOSC N-terminal beta barrel domain-containing protein [Pseudomonadota bacterium]
MATVRAIWRHPIKAHGRESVDRVVLKEGQTMPWDRTWAVAHELSDADGTNWAPCRKFTRASAVPSVQGINAQVDEAGGRLTLSHPALDDLTFNPDREPEAFLAWVRQIMPAEKPQSVRLVRAAAQGMTDTNYPSVSLINLASHAAVAQLTDPDLSVQRWRCNVHLDGLEAWAEFDWVGKTIRAGEVELHIEEPIERCKVPAANPETGLADTDILGALMRGFGHVNFGVSAVVTKTGSLGIGDRVELI